jgi:hypothetical protein
MSKSKTAGVGIRYGAVYNLIDGLPLPAVASATPMNGTLIEGIKTNTVSDPAPRRITHFGDDRAYAQDSLPATESGSFNFTTSKSNMDLDAMLEGGQVRTINSNKFLAGNTDNKGSEPQVLLNIYRQALDVDKTSATFGKLRQWEGRLYPSVRITKTTPSYEAENTDITYEATPTPVKYTAWGEQFTEANWGVTEGEYISYVTDYHPRFNFYRGDGTITGFALTHPPVDSNAITVWVDGTATTPSAVNTNSTNPAFTLGSAAGVGKLVTALIETNAPGDN